MDDAVYVLPGASGRGLPLLQPSGVPAGTAAGGSDRALRGGLRWSLERGTAPRANHGVPEFTGGLRSLMPDSLGPIPIPDPPFISPFPLRVDFARGVDLA